MTRLQPSHRSTAPLSGPAPAVASAPAPTRATDRIPLGTPASIRALGSAFALAVLVALAPSAAAAGAAPGGLPALLPPAPGDLAPAALAAEAPPVFAVPPAGRRPVEASWALDHSRALDPAPAPHRAASRGYWQQVEAAELLAGVPLYTTAPGAVVRLSPIRPTTTATPAAGSATALDPAGLVLTGPDGAVFADGAGMDRLAGAEALAAAGADFPAGSTAFRVRAALGAGRLVLRATALPAAAAPRYLVHVFEPASDLVLALAAGRDAYLAGGTLTVEAALTVGGRPLGAGEAGEAEGWVSAPDGRLWPVAFRPTAAGGWRASVRLDGGGSAVPGPWEAHLNATASRDGLTAVRSVRTAFAVAVPTARLTGEAAVAAAPGGGGRHGATGGDLAIALGVETAVAGRYEIRGTLWGTDAAGALRPLAVAHSAAWLEPGSGTLELRFGGDLLAPSPLGAPYELRDLRLVDQGRMGLLHRQARGLAVTP